MATWIPVLAACVPALIAGYYANRARTAELEAQRLLELERRVAASKGKVFEELVEAITLFWNEVPKRGGEPIPPEWFEEHVLPHLKSFTDWVQIYGTDDSVRLYHRYMQATYADAPS